METKQILKDIGQRCQGDIYLGVVGPVRSGKSSFIKRFMEMAVIPYIENPDVRLRTIDELPQSGKGKMIMTVEPKFIPNQAVSIDLQEDLKINVRLVDCVGYVIEGASGYQDDSGIRLVKTPWYNESIPFDQAAKIGTKKVIQDHSTIGIVMTSDGSFLDIEERNYHQATQKISLKNCKILENPLLSLSTAKILQVPLVKMSLKAIVKEHDVPVIGYGCNKHVGNASCSSYYRRLLMNLVLRKSKSKYHVTLLCFHRNHWLKQTLDEALRNSLVEIKKIRDIQASYRRYGNVMILLKEHI